MKLNYCFVLVIFALMTGGCGKNPNKLNLSGTVKNVSSGTIYLQRYENKSFLNIDSTEIVNGAFKFTGEVKLPEIYGLAIDNSGNPFHSFIIFLDNNPVKVELDTVNEFKNTVVTGSKEQDLLKEFSGKFRTPVSEILKEHPSSLAALYVFYRYYSYRLSSEEIKENLKLLDPKFQHTEYVKVLSELAENIDRVASGKKAPDFRALTREGKSVSLYDFIGRGYVLIDFWASWCAPCRKENPDLVKLYDKYRNKGFELISVSLDHKTDAWIKAIEKDGLTWIQLVDFDAWAGDGVKTYGVRLIPYKFLIDKNGVIVAKNLRGENLDELLNKYLN
ncbi:MAG: AhpC/TSA family protein [Prevotellaceae bacterium]|jgi:peroxiredoxin|nr:AhpC/TSA family protein [Prevotellaceae bacterium]